MIDRCQECGARIDTDPDWWDAGAVICMALVGSVLGVYGLNYIEGLFR